MKALAARSAAGARSTSDLVEHSVREAEAGMAVRNEVLESIESMGLQMARLAEIIQQVKVGSDELERSAQEIEVAIREVAESSQSSLQASENSAAASLSLSEEVSSLQTLVARMRGEAHSPAASARRQTTTGA